MSAPSDRRTRRSPRTAAPATAAALVLAAAALVLAAAACSRTSSGRTGDDAAPALGRAVAGTAPAPSAAATGTGGTAVAGPPHTTVIASSGGIVQATPLGWRVTLSVPGGRALSLSDRPAHGPTHPPVLDVVTAWLAAGGPARTAAISGTGPDGAPLDLAVEVADPAWNAIDDTLMVTVRGIGADTGRVLPPWLGPLALYLDDARDPVAVDVVDGSTVDLHVEALLPEASRWTAGPAPGTDPTGPFGPAATAGTRRTLTLSADPGGAPDAAAVVLAGPDGTRWILHLARDGHGGSTATLTRDAAWSTVAVGLDRAPIGTPVPLSPSGPGVGGGSTYTVAFADAP